MDKTGFLSCIAEAEIAIDAGRKGFAKKGMAEEGRISYEKGISDALNAFTGIQTTTDPELLLLAEYTFLSLELQFCDESDKDSINSLTKAIQSFDDAFLALRIAEEKKHYYAVDNSIPHNGKYRVNGFPKDSFHIACISHKTRLQNILRTPGIDPIEKALLKQRHINLSAAQGAYLGMQKKALIG